MPLSRRKIEKLFVASLSSGKCKADYAQIIAFARLVEAEAFERARKQFYNGTRFGVMSVVMKFCRDEARRALKENK